MNKLNELHTDIELSYDSSQSNYQISLLDKIDQKVKSTYEEELYEIDNNSSVSLEEYMKYYNELKDKFKVTFMKEITYDFMNSLL